jgi:hypothetical protein
LDNPVSKKTTIIKIHSRKNKPNCLHFCFGSLLIAVEDKKLKKKESTAEDKQAGLHANLHFYLMHSRPGPAQGQILPPGH